MAVERCVLYMSNFKLAPTSIKTMPCSFERWCIAIKNEFGWKPISHADVLTNLPPVDVMMVRFVESTSGVKWLNYSLGVAYIFTESGVRGVLFEMDPIVVILTHLLQAGMSKTYYDSSLADLINWGRRWRLRWSVL